MIYIPVATANNASKASPWHAGERDAQSRAGVREMMEEIGQRVLRPFMPEQHRTFFGQLPFLVVGSVDAGNQPWASVLAAPPGFVSSPDPQHLEVHAAPLPGDVLMDNIRPDASIALLGIEPHTRRRNRMNGVVERVDEEGFRVRVGQSFGNCPKYIQARRPEYLEQLADQAGRVREGDRLDEAARALIRRADTFFIATAHPQAQADGEAYTPSHGVDVSHRGGRPGFVDVATDAQGRDVLTVPDFAGNQFFNTIGNLTVQPRAGLLFIDFDSGDLLQLSVEGEVIWEGPEVEAFMGALRLLRLRVTHMRYSAGVLPLRFGEAVESPFLGSTGTWG